ncbi:hypothetical protein [Corynebacterium renale]|uniref:hypothetical protein n=1 Tax=Corynebacterium renale TaxID=1724 RepID=UPI000DFC2BAF|nr:hypothetical protein [Corynebacterium renale]STC97781.1 Uncharacterised protein [Corynebacterium renale]STD70255.1 Uncharacterised protein [Corynebacterium renale]
MKKLAAITIATTLALTGCSNATEPTPETITQQPLATTEAPTQNEGVLGKPLQIAHNPGNDVQMTIEDIKLGGECTYGNLGWNEDPAANQPPAGKQLLQLWANVDVVQVQTTVGNSWISLDDPSIVDKDGYTQSVEMDMNCRDSAEGHQIWHSPIDSGDKMRLYGSFIVPDDIQELRIMGIKFPVEAAS